MLPELLVRLPICRQLAEALAFVATLSLAAIRFIIESDQSEISKTQD